MSIPTTSSFAHVTGTATLSGATVNAIYANGSYVSKQYTILTAGNVSGTFGSLVNTNLPANFTTSLSYDQTDAFLNLTLNFTPPPAGPNFGGGLNANQQNVANALTNFFNATGGIPLVFGTLTPAGLTQASGELATGSQQTTFDAMNLFMGLHDRSVRRRPRRWREPPARARRRAMPRTQTTGADARRLCDVHQGAAGRALRAALERVGGGLWRLADHRRQCRARLQQHDLERRRHRRRRRLSLLAVYDRGLCAGRRRHQLSASPAAAPGIPTCSRPAPSSATMPGRPISRPRWPMAGRTSPPTAR